MALSRCERRAELSEYEGGVCCDEVGTCDRKCMWAEAAQGKHVPDCRCGPCLRQDEAAPVWRGVKASSSFEHVLDDALAELRELMISRHKKYGPGNIAKHGEVGIKVRLDDKFARLDNGFENDFADESVGDTIDDVIGYGLIWKLWRAGKWPS